jgi:hypothetical protein
LKHNIEPSNEALPTVYDAYLSHKRSIESDKNQLKKGSLLNKQTIFVTLLVSEKLDKVASWWNVRKEWWNRDYTK